MRIDDNARTILLALTAKESEGERARERDYPHKTRFREFADIEMGYFDAVSAER